MSKHRCGGIDARSYLYEGVVTRLILKVEPRWSRDFSTLYIFPMLEHPCI